MLRVGNDVVDLSASGTAGKSADSRFLQKVLTGREQDALREAGRPDTCLWSMWAAKETAYKVLRKKWPDIPAWPRQYEAFLKGVDSAGACSGIVKTPREPVAVVLAFGGDYIHCVGHCANGPLAEQVVCGVEKMAASPPAGFRPDPRRQSAEVRRAAAARLASCLGVAPEDIGIIRPRGPAGLEPPMVRIRGESCGIDISLSHHGRFVAFAFCFRFPFVSPQKI